MFIGFDLFYSIPWWGDIYGHRPWILLHSNYDEQLTEWRSKRKLRAVCQCHARPFLMARGNAHENHHRTCSTIRFRAALRKLRSLRKAKK